MLEDYEIAPEKSEYQMDKDRLAREYENERTHLQKYLTATGTRNGREEEIRTTPLFSLAVKHHVDNIADRTTCCGTYIHPEVLTQYGLLGFHIGDNPNIPSKEPLHMNVDAPNSAFICGSQGMFHHH